MKKRFLAVILILGLFSTGAGQDCAVDGVNHCVDGFYVDMRLCGLIDEPGGFEACERRANQNLTNCLWLVYFVCQGI